MNYLNVQQLTKYYGEKPLFESLSFSIDKGQKVAFIAKNGSGKSTLLKILAGLEPPDAGTYQFHKDIHIGILEQEPIFAPELTVYQTLLQQKNVKLEAALSYEQALEGKGNLDKAIEQLDALNAWDYEAEVKHILSKLDIHHMNQQVGCLSGGQQRRLSLAALLIHTPDILLLDEPTNHLDIEMIEWLEGFLTQSHITLLLITHDRYFLENICNEILELDHGVLYKHKGNYGQYLENKLLREENLKSNTLKAQNIYRRELEWMRRQPKARTTKAKSRIDAFEDVSDRAHRKITNEKIAIEVKMERLGGKILELHNVSKSIADKMLIHRFTYKFKKGERIGIVGKNGSGKSTLLNIIAGMAMPDDGNIVTGETVKIGYYNQKGLQLKSDKRVLEIVQDIAEVLPIKGGTISASQLLERFLFSHAQQQQYFSTLSGGEKKRLFLLTILISNPNLLILDEPTNDLDIMTLNVLEEFLENFQGCLIIVSHDRYFLNSLTDHLFIFENDGHIKDYNGNYSDYIAERKIQKSLQNQSQPKKNELASSNVVKKKLNFNEKREMEQLEKDLLILQTLKIEINALICSSDTPHHIMASKAEELQQVMSQIDEKELRWLELSEYGE
jgi:ATP-binding cassette subfamily F protein uup